MKSLSLNMKNKKGSAIVIAIFFAFCMLILLGAMVFRQSSTKSHNQISILDKQALLAARSAMQHFLLKAKLFPTELYDAVEISQGKNPLFNFTEFPAQDDNGNELFEEFFGGGANLYVKRKLNTGDNDYDSGDFVPDGKPRYYYLKLPSKDSFIRLASYNNPDYRFLTLNMAQSMQNVKYTDPNPSTLKDEYYADKYLTYYYRDCNNYSDSKLQPLLETVKSNKIKNPNTFDISVEDGYPYTLSYSVLEVKVKALQGMRKYGEEAIEITVEGNVTNFQKKNCSQLYTRTQKITRKGGDIGD